MVAQTSSDSYMVDTLVYSASRGEDTVAMVNAMQTLLLPLESKESKIVLDLI